MPVSPGSASGRARRQAAVPAFARPALAVAVAVLVLGTGVAVFVGVATAHGPAWVDIAALTLVASSLALFVLVWFRGRLLVRQSTVVGRQGAILDAAAFAAQRFLEPDALDAGVDEILARLGAATTASRVYVFENGWSDGGQLLMSVRHEWTAPSVASMDARWNQDWPYDDGFAHWATALSAGEPIQTRRSEARDTELQDMQEASILSHVAVPVFVSGAWWGYVGFDDCSEERVWTETDLDALAVVAATYGAAISRRRVAEAMRRAEDRYRTLVEQLPVAVYIDGLDDHATTLYISPQIERLIGYTADEWEHDPELWPRLLHPEDRDRALAAQARHNETGQPFREEYRMIARGGDVVWIRDEAVIVEGPDGRFLYSQGILQDVSDVKEAEAQVAFLAFRDRLTGLPNDTMFSEIAEMALARARRNDRAVAVLFVDVDRFKLVNDSVGPETGDALLQRIAERLQQAIRDTDTLARRGGDEFVVLLADLDRGEVGEMSSPLLFAESVAGRIREMMAEPFVAGDDEVFLSVSVGISVMPDDASDVWELLQHAETAMGRSKQDGPGGFAASTIGAVDAATKLAFVTRLRKAVVNREWELHYQPIVELATGAAVGVEALLRWRTSQGDLIPPNEFIPLAEELGLIEEIGDWVVEELVSQDHAWRADGLRLEMGFNLSPRQFWQPDLADRILSRLALRRVDPTNVIVEVTESSAMRDPERAHAVLWDLHARGLRVAIDDFGTGYSSLSRLRQLPIDVLKIDRSFVREVDRDRQAATIVAAFIQLGQGLGMTTLAEGIETEAEWRFLAERGCELGQGYYFSRPVPAEEIAARYRAGDLLVADRS
jgi:diguanylate cyclase (GGDEF)-like protein/PAS domain S-box-containing protein